MLFYNNHHPRVLTLPETIARIIGMLLTGIFFLLVGTSTVLAQLERVESGDRVKLSVPLLSPQSIVGTVSKTGSSELVLSVKDSLLFVHPSNIKKIAVSKGRKRNTLKGALIGTGSGALLGGIIGAATYTECTDEGFLACMMHPETQGDAFLFGAVLGAVTGLVVGTVIGIGTKSDRWEKIPVRFSMAPAPSERERFKLHPQVTLRLPLIHK